jgi:hypothetical protein
MHGFAVAPDGSIYLGALLSGGSVDLDPGAGTDMHVNGDQSSSSDDTIVVKVKDDGSYGWGRVVKAVGADSSYQQLTGLAATADGGVIASGGFEGVVNFASPGGSNRRDAKNGSLCVVHWSASGAPRWALTVASGAGRRVAASASGFVVVGAGGSGDYNPGGGDPLVIQGTNGIISRYGF